MAPCFIITHNVPQEWVREGSPFTFVTDGIESAIRQAKKAAGDKNVAICTASIAFELAGTQTGRPLPAKRWASAKVPTLVMVGSKSEVFFHTGAKALASLQPGVHYRSLDGGHHGSIMAAPKSIAAAVEEFFLQ